MKRDVPLTAAPKRCAVYTRVSSDERLDQSFNSLDAQREAGLAFIASQRHEGWIAVPDAYDDGGFSGGTTNRPALQRLLADIDAKRIDIVVVYKLDRLSRSLKDFMNLREVFDERGVTFASVTEQFQTTSADGRLHLNMTLSFAQYMREQTGERIRDKIAASKRRGLWMGGTPPLGYDVVNRQLVINEPEAALVRAIFARYAEHGSAAQLVRQLAAEGRTTKSWVTQDGKQRHGNPIDQQLLFVMLRNRLYRGEMTYKSESFRGQHAPIIDAPLWDTVQSIIEKRKHGSRRKHTNNPALLAGLLYSIDGQRMLPTYTQRANGKRYTYYVPYFDKRRHANSGPSRTIGALEIERLVLAQVHQRLQQPEVIIGAWQNAHAVRDGSEATLPAIDEAQAVVALRGMADAWARLYPAEQHRILRLSIERVQFVQEGVCIVWNDRALLNVTAEIAQHPFVLEQRASNDADVEFQEVA